jgi:hypothetical protein
MAWPNDARHTSFAAAPAQEQVASAFLNAVQDAIIALYAKAAALFGIEDLVEVTAVPEIEGATLSWGVDQATPEAGWRCVTTGTALFFFVRARHGCVVSQVIAKIYNSAGTGATIPMVIYKPTLNMAAPATGPALGSALFTNAAVAPATAWSIVDSGALTVTLGYGEYLLVAIGKNAASQTGDKVAGVEVVAQPIAVPT